MMTTSPPGEQVAMTFKAERSSVCGLVSRPLEQKCLSEVLRSCISAACQALRSTSRGLNISVELCDACREHADHRQKGQTAEKLPVKTDVKYAFILPF